MVTPTYHRYAAQTFVMLQLLGTGIAQIIACATDYYAVDKSYTKRSVELLYRS